MAGRRGKGTGQAAPPVDAPNLLDGRALFTAILNYKGRDERMFAEVLAPAMPAWSAFADRYARYRRFASAPPFVQVRESPWSDLWTFYALSRVFESLIIGIQDRAGLPRKDPRWPAHPFPVPPRDELLRFFAGFGMEPMAAHLRYHPFFHEVVAAEPDATLGDAVLVEEELWPGLWFGDLVFARAGVRLRCGPAALFDPAIAARSTLYFAWTRVHRRVCDLSHGWGSNSQWGTSFRRDYADGALLRYNVDGRVRLTGDTIIPPPDCQDDPEDHDDLTPAERVELLTHRCFVRTAKPDEDRWPFDDTYAEAAPEPGWA